MKLNPRTRLVVQEAFNAEEEEIAKLESQIGRLKDQIFVAERELAEHRRQHFALENTLKEDK